jgi:hypothetical protein
MGARKDSGLPFKYSGTVKFKDYAGKKGFPVVEFVIDLQVMLDRGFVNVYSIHHAAEALRKIDRTLEQWTEPDELGSASLVGTGSAKIGASANTLRASARAEAHQTNWRSLASNRQRLPIFYQFERKPRQLRATRIS